MAPVRPSGSNIQLAGYVPFEIDPSAKAVAQKAYPEVIGVGDATALSDVTMAMILWSVPGATLVAIAGGSPCQDVSGLNATGVSVHGVRSRLYKEFRRIRNLVRKVGPHLLIQLLIENVASMSKESAAAFTADLGATPLRICSEGLGWCGRPCLYWIDWAISSGPGVDMEMGTAWHCVTIRAQRKPLRNIIERGWWPVEGEQACFPTFVRFRSRPARKPPFLPAGVRTASPRTLQRWKQDEYRFAPYQYHQKYMLSNGNSSLRYRTQLSDKF